MPQKIDVFKFIIFLVGLLISTTLSFGEIRRDLFIIKGDTAGGSGFSLNYNGGFYLCTNQHVVVGQNQIEVENTMGEQIALSDEVLFPTDERDLILIKLLSHKTGFNVTNSINFGEEVTSYGNSGGENVITQKIGKVLGIGNTEVEYDNPTVSGDSGSAVLNTSNQVVAVVTKGLKDQQMNAWLEDRPEMHTRRFGTRIDNAKWRKTNLSQLFRISKIYNRIFELDKKWQQEYKTYKDWKNFFISKFVQKTFVRDRILYTYYISNKRFIQPENFNPDVDKYQTPRLPSFIQNWQANFALLEFLNKFNYTGFYEHQGAEGLRKCFSSYDSAFYSNFNSEIQNLSARFNDLPKSWFSERVVSELGYVKLSIDNFFEPPAEEPNFTNRNRLFSDNETNRFAWQLGPDEITFFVSNNLNRSDFQILEYNNNLINFISECRNFTSTKGGKEIDRKKSMRDVIYKYDRRNLHHVENSKFAKTWSLKNYQPKLEKALDESAKTGNFAFLANFRGSALGYAHYKTLHGINERLSPLFDDLCENIYDSASFTEKLGYIINLSSQYHSDEELTFYKSLQ